MVVVSLRASFLCLVLTAFEISRGKRAPNHVNKLLRDFFFMSKLLFGGVSGFLGVGYVVSVKG